MRGFLGLGLMVLTAALAQAPGGAPPPRFSVTTVALADYGVDLPSLDDEGRILDNVHLGANPGWLHLGYRRYLRPIERGGRTEMFWGVGALVPFDQPGLLLRYNYLSVGLERFLTPQIYAGTQIHFSPGVLYHVLYGPADPSGSTDMSFLLIFVPTFYVGFALF
ncbi:hypothetical protein Ocepr_1407 [Oceanithermus profundus DSM 14977]|uniref:Uncharacterized protein n=2 Tax=Oceanithermus profundus TaxID=187137 RepID=E4U933_OCEP5|nr:hypothetical protein Ocepr_1407 [Oceanithermus profundus DSM 14977]